MPAAPALRATPLNSVHRALGARMVDFGGWDMPVQYSGIIDEHNAVRNAVGVFDVSHMGEIEIRGPEAAQLTDYVTTNAVAEAEDSARRITPACSTSTAASWTTSWCTRWRTTTTSSASTPPTRIRISSTSSRRTASTPWWRITASATRRSPSRGRRRSATLQKLTPVDLGGIKYYWFTDGEVAGTPARIAHTGYTGEDGFEIYVPPAEAERMWKLVMDAGAEFGIKPCGLGARNTLRLEAKMALYGHEIDASISPLEADLGWIVKLDKGEFVGRDALLKQKESGIRRKLVGFRNARPRHRPRRLRSAVSTARPPAG